MKSPAIKLNTKVTKIGDLESYLHLPIMIDGKAIGIVYNVEELEDEYELGIAIWSRFIHREIIDNKLTSIIIK